MKVQEKEWFANQGDNIRICILDSGTKMDDDSKKMGLVYSNEKIEVSNDYSDTIGHGTAVHIILKRELPKAMIQVIKIFDDNVTINEDALCAYLEYIYENIQCDILSMSFGLAICHNIPKLYSICKRICDKGVMLVAAFGNEGGISYPACFPFVVGVDMSLELTDVYAYEYYKNNPVNIRGAGGYKRVRWGENVQTVYGSSFTVPYIVSFIAKIMEYGHRLPESIFKELEGSAINSVGVINQNSEKSKKIGERIALFPCSKEMKTVLMNRQYLSHSIIGALDLPRSGNVGKVHFNQVIMSLYSEDIFNKIDTLIIGHISRYRRCFGDDFLEYVKKMCEQRGVGIYCFDDDLQDFFSVSYFDCPKIEKTQLNYNEFRNGKLYRIGKPILGIFGTSASQGKFTLQLKIRNCFEQSGYSVGTLGTEPSAKLFGFDAVYPMGYRSTVYLNEYESVFMLNRIMQSIEAKNPDIILVASQSQTIANNWGNLGQLPLSQYDFLLGTRPDAFILCVNLFDEIDYIKRTIHFLEITTKGKVIAMAALPMKITSEFVKDITEPEVVNDFAAMKIKLEQEIGIPLFNLAVDSEIGELYKLCVKFFSES